MNILMVGTGSVGAAVVAIAARRGFFDSFVAADYSVDRAKRAVAAVADDRFTATTVDASSTADIAELCRTHDITHVLNAVDPRFTMSVFDGALNAGAHYLDMAMSLSRPHPEEPYRRTGIKLGDEQFAAAPSWEAAGQLALVGMGVEPGMSDVFARYAADHLFSAIDELGVRDGANLEVQGYAFAPTFSIWTTIEECLNPPVIYEHERGWYTTEPFSEPEVFDFPEGIGPVECVNVEHEEVVLIPRWVRANRVTFKYGLGTEFIEVLKTLHKLGLDSTTPVSVGGTQVIAPRRRSRLSSGPGHARTANDREDVRGYVGARTGSRGSHAGDVSVPRGRQRVVDARVRASGRVVADRDQSRRGVGAAGVRGVVGFRRAGSRGVRPAAVPRPAHRVRLAVGRPLELGRARRGAVRTVRRRQLSRLCITCLIRV